MVRVRKSKESLGDYIYKHSPIKKGAIKVKNEDDVYHKVDKIMNRIYLGNVEAAHDPEFFKKRNIKAVLNCSKDIPNYFYKNKDVEYMRIPIDDSLKEIDFEKAYNFMPAAVEFIHKHADLEKHNIFIHCWAGRQRSCIMLIAYLVAKHKMTPKQASRYIMDKRPEVLHYGKSYNFESSIERFYKDLQKKPR